MFDKTKWIGKTFRCKDTGVTLTLTDKEVRPKAYIAIGKGAIDLGDGYYWRTNGNIEEVV